MNSVTEHVKKITKQNDELYNQINKHEQNITDILNEIMVLRDKQPSDIKSDDLATKNDLSALIDDIQNSFEYVMTQTPRNTDQIKSLLDDFDSFRKQIAEIKTELTNIRNELKNEQVISSLDVDMPEKHVSSSQPLRKLNIKKDVVLRKSL